MSRFVLLVYAESRKVFSRGSGLGALVVALLVGGLAVVGMAEMKNVGEGAQFNGQPVADFMTFSAIASAGLGLQMRNFFVLPTLLLLATASTVAGEQSDRTLRELVVRPVPRPTILLAKLSALTLLSAATLVLTYVPALGGGLALWGAPTDSPVDVSLGYLASLGSDVGLILIGMLASLLVSSVGGVVVTVVLVLLADWVVGLLLKGLSMLKVDGAETAAQFTLNHALGAWDGWKDGWVPERFAALALVVVVTGVLSTVRFQRMDVP